MSSNFHLGDSNLNFLKCLDISFRENLVGPNFCTSCFPFSSLLRFREVAAMSIFRAHSCSKSRVRAIQPHLPTRACIRSAWICPCAHPSLFLHKPRTHVNVTKQLDEPRKRKNKFVGSVGNTNTIVCAHTSTAPSGPANARRANERPFYLCEKYVPSSTITSDGHRDAS